MSTLDLTEAVEAALHEYTRFGATFVDAITAAAPLIAAQVREQIIETLHAERDEITGSRGPQDEPIAAESAFLSGLDHAIEVIEDGAR